LTALVGEVFVLVEVFQIADKDVFIDFITILSTKLE
jgi:hypothetical protein